MPKKSTYERAIINGGTETGIAASESKNFLPRNSFFVQKYESAKPINVAKMLERRACVTVNAAMLKMRGGKENAASVCCEKTMCATFASGRISTKATSEKTENKAKKNTIC